MMKGLRRFWRHQFRNWRERGPLSADWWLSRVPFWLTPQFYWLLITFPFRWFFTAWHDRRMSTLLLGLPAVFGIGGTAWLAQAVLEQDRIVSYDYWSDAQRALAKEEYGAAEVLLDRILQENQANVEEARLGLATLYEETGNEARAELLFNVLAPDNDRGHPEAHQRMAVLLSAQVAESPTEELVSRLKWHLDQGRDTESPEMCLAWSRYELVIGELERARDFLEVAAQTFPEVWFTLGQVNTRLGDQARALSSYEKASEFLASQMQNAAAPSGEASRSMRVNYATVLMRLGRMNDARDVLERGLQEDPEGDWRQLLAALYVNYHDLLSVQGDQSISNLLRPISKSLEQEPNFGPALNRLMAYANAKTDGNVELRKVLARVVAEGEEPALAHLALGNLCWMEDDKDGAVFHFERSIGINPKLSVVLNNLAWLVAHDAEAPDYDRAIALVNTALEESPGNASFLDTRGTILMKQGKFREALEDLEPALQGVRDRVAVHRKLAEVYDQLGRAEMSEQHRLLAEQEAATTEKTPQDGLSVINE